MAARERPRARSRADSGTAEAAVRLSLAILRLRSRLREEAGPATTHLTISQLSYLSRIIDEGPITAASLAAAEHVTQQNIAQSLRILKDHGVVRTDPDPADRRKQLISATPAGRRVHDELLNTREAWLTRAIEETITPRERARLEQTIALIERLADADPGSGAQTRPENRER